MKLERDGHSIINLRTIHGREAHRETSCKRQQKKGSAEWIRRTRITGIWVSVTSPPPISRYKLLENSSAKSKTRLQWLHRLFIDWFHHHRHTLFDAVIPTSYRHSLPLSLVFNHERQEGKLCVFLRVRMREEEASNSNPWTKTASKE